MTAFKLALEIAQECVQRAPVIVLGSGASAAHRLPGMPQLRDHLVASTLPTGLGARELDLWQEFLNAAAVLDLEEALTAVALTDALTAHVVAATWDLLAPTDMAVFEQVVRDRHHLPLTRLFQHLLKSTHTEINVVTPNYDRLAEYAADAGGLCHHTGFGHGYLRLRQTDHPLKFTQNQRPVRTVNVWKVHGSLDWFRDPEGTTVGLPILPSRPAGMTPVIVTPGVEKYRITHDEPFRTILAGADTALATARAYLCIGYGFNDTHIQPKLLERCRTQPVPLVLITKAVSPTAKDFLLKGGCRRFMALEESGTGSRLYSAEYPNGVDLLDRPVWRLDEFLEMVM